MYLSTCFCQQTAVYVSRTGLTRTLSCIPTGECGKLGLNAKHFCYSASLLLHPSFVLHSFAQFLLESLQMSRYAKENRRQGLRLWLAWQEVPEKQKTRELCKHHSRKTAGRTTPEGGKVNN